MFEEICTVFWRDWLVLNRRMVRFILSRMIAPVLYLIAFGWGLGRNIQLGSGNYLDYIVPGIIALNSMNISFNAVGSPLTISRLYYKNLEEYIVAPIRPLSLVLGKVLAGAFKGFLSSVIIIALAYVFGAKFAVNGWSILIIIVNCMIFAALAVIAAMTVVSHEDMGNFNTYILLPMSFLCGTFFSADRMPGAVKWLINILPLTHATAALRTVGAGNDLLVLPMLVLMLYLAVFLVIAVWSLENAYK